MTHTMDKDDQNLIDQLGLIRIKQKQLLEREGELITELKTNGIDYDDSFTGGALFFLTTYWRTPRKLNMVRLKKRLTRELGVRLGRTIIGRYMEDGKPTLCFRTRIKDDTLVEQVQTLEL